MRMDVRARIIHYLDLASRHVRTMFASCQYQANGLLQGNYCPDREVGEPDPHIIDLNLELAELDDIVASTVPRTEQQYVDHILVSPLSLSFAQLYLRRRWVAHG